MNKKHIFIWSLYDFANSFVFITFLLYFSKWLVVNKGLSDWWYNATYIIGSIGLIFFAPWLGKKADLYNKGRKYLIFSTITCFVFYALAIFAGLSGGPILWPALFFGLGNFFYQLSFVFYNPLLDNISAEHNKGRISGLGYLANYLGQIVGLLVAIPFVSGKLSLGISDPLLSALIPATAIFLILALPLMLNRKIFERKIDSGNISPRKTLRQIVALPGVLVFLIAFFLFSDALTTIVNNFSIYTSSVFAATDSKIGILTLLVIVCAGAGSMFWGWLADKKGAAKTLTINLFIWIILIILLAWAGSFEFFFLMSLLTGLTLGGTWSVSRRLLIQLVPKENLNSAFGVYAISERASTIVGPLGWSLALSLGNYRWAMFSMIIFQIIAVVMIWGLYKKYKK